MVALFAEQALAQRERLSRTFGPARGVSLLELLIVLAIIGIMMGMLFPAIQAARQSSHVAACENNAHQIVLAMEQYLDINNRFFPMPPDDTTPSGWMFALLPYIEEQLLYDRFSFNQALTSPRNLEAALHRPGLLVCPVTLDLESTIKGVGVTHYFMFVDQKDRARPRRDRRWTLGEVSENSRFPWITSPEVDYLTVKEYQPPHPSAFGF